MSGRGVRRKYVTGETIQTAINFFATHRDVWEEFQNVSDLQAWMAENSQAIDENPASWCAVELALFDCWGQEEEQSIESLLNLHELTGPFQYSAVLGTENLPSFQKQAQQFSELGFSGFQSESLREILRMIAKKLSFSKICLLKSSHTLRCQ